MTKTEMLALVRTYCAESSTQTLSDAIINAALSRAYARTSQLLHAHTSGVLTADAVQNQARYSLSAFGPTGAGSRIYKVTGVWYNSQRLGICTYSRLLAAYPNAPFESSATPRLCAMVDPHTFFIFPAPNANATGILACEGFATPDLSSWTTPDLHESIHDLLVYHAAASLLVGIIEDEANAFRENRFGGLFWSGITTARTMYANVSPADSRLGTGTDSTIDEFPYGYELGIPVS